MLCTLNIARSDFKIMSIVKQQLLRDGAVQTLNLGYYIVFSGQILLVLIKKKACISLRLLENLSDIA